MQLRLAIFVLCLVSPMLAWASWFSASSAPAAQGGIIPFTTFQQEQQILVNTLPCKWVSVYGKDGAQGTDTRYDFLCKGGAWGTVSLMLDGRGLKDNTLGRIRLIWREWPQSIHPGGGEGMVAQQFLQHVINRFVPANQAPSVFQAFFGADESVKWRSGKVLTMHFTREDTPSFILRRLEIQGLAPRLSTDAVANLQEPIQQPLKPQSLPQHPTQLEKTFKPLFSVIVTPTQLWALTRVPTPSIVISGTPFISATMPLTSSTWVVTPSAIVSSAILLAPPSPTTSVSTSSLVSASTISTSLARATLTVTPSVVVSPVTTPITPAFTFNPTETQAKSAQDSQDMLEDILPTPISGTGITQLTIAPTNSTAYQRALQLTQGLKAKILPKKFDSVIVTPTVTASVTLSVAPSTSLPAVPTPLVTATSKDLSTAPEPISPTTPPLPVPVNMVPSAADRLNATPTNFEGYKKAEKLTQPFAEKALTQTDAKVLVKPTSQLISGSIFTRIASPTITLPAAITSTLPNTPPDPRYIPQRSLPQLKFIPKAQLLEPDNAVIDFENEGSSL